MEKHNRQNKNLFFRVIKSLQIEHNFINRTGQVKLRKGDLLTEEVMVMDRWNEYFVKFLGNEDTSYEIEQEGKKIPVERQ